MKRLAKTVTEISVPSPATLAELESTLRSLGATNSGAVAQVVIRASVAAEILAAWNEGNRRLDDIAVQRYRRDMQARRWQQGSVVGFGVFESNCAVGDGQHRYAAQVASGTDQVYSVRIFTDQKEFEWYVATIDGGRVRSLADILRIFGVAESTAAATTFERVVNAMHAFTGAKAGRLSKQERLDFANRYIVPIRYVLKLNHREFKAHVLAAIAFAYSKYPTAVEAFIASVTSGANLPARSPALVLAKSLPELNAARDAVAKDRAMAKALRLIHDGISSVTKSSARLRITGDATVRAVSELVSKVTADNYASRCAK